MVQSATCLHGDNKGIESQRRQGLLSCMTTQSGSGPHPTYYPTGSLGSFPHNTASENNADHSQHSSVKTNCVTLLPRLLTFACLEFSEWDKFHFESGQKIKFLRLWINEEHNSYQRFCIHQLMLKWIVLKTNLKFTLKFTLKQLRHYSCLLWASTSNALPDDGVTAPKHVGALLLLILM